ncbi:hypothetical protein HDV06_001962 [Boothiomyces sp. JEL0866]|nr:hypothetical protein HDV06_001962 [Boothiomyces sp. JEL0866]
MIPIPAIPAALQNQLVDVAKSIYICSQDKRFGGIFHELTCKIEFITTELENFKSNYNPEVENKLKSLLNELNEILSWIQDLLKLSVLNRIVRLKKIVNKIKSYEKQLDLHLQDALTKIIQEQLLNGFNEPMKLLLEHLQEKSGRCVKTEFEFKNISVDEIEFLEHNPIAVGSHGKVYKVEYEGKVCALKQALEEIKGQSAADMIEKEFQLWYDLKPHPNVVPLLGACLNTDKPFLLMPFYQYGDVYSYISKNPALSIKDRVGFILDIAYGMNHLHFFKIVHGDIKGDNVMISQTDGKFVCAITDFGLSYLKQSTGSSSNQKRTGAIRWIAPERYKRGSKVTGESLDVFAFAMTAYQILSGRIPFSEQQDDEVVKEWIKDGERPGKPSTVPDNIWNIITDCWAHNPSERPSFAQITLKLQKEFKSISLGAKTVVTPLNTKKDEASTVCNSPASSRVRSNSLQQSQSPRFNPLNFFSEASSSFSKTVGAMSSTLNATILSISKPNDASTLVAENPVLTNPNTKAVIIANALYKYESKNAGEMSFAKGDTVCVVDPREKYWKAFRFGKCDQSKRTLLIDPRYFEIIQEKSVFSVEIPFYRTNEKELQLMAGDQVEILENTFDGWARAKNIENGKVGLMMLNICSLDAVPTNPVINIQDFSTEPQISYMDGATPLYLEKSKNRWRLSTNVIHESNENPISDGSSMHFVLSSDFGSFDKFESNIDLRKGDVIAVTKVFEDCLTVQNLTTRRSGSIRTNLSSLSALKINEWETLEVTVLEIVQGKYTDEKCLLLSKRDSKSWQVCILSNGEFCSLDSSILKPIVQDYQHRFMASQDFDPIGNEELAVKKGDCITLKNVFEDGSAFATNVCTANTGMINVNILRLQ